MTQNEADGRLFETTVPGSEWLEFQASGFDRPVSGIVHRTDRPPSCGMPLGGISTGCLEIVQDIGNICLGSNGVPL